MAAEPFRVAVESSGSHYWVKGPDGRQFGDRFTWESDARKLAKLLNEAFVIGEQRTVKATSERRQPEPVEWPTDVGWWWMDSPKFGTPCLVDRCPGGFWLEGFFLLRRNGAKLARSFPSRSDTDVCTTGA